MAEEKATNIFLLVAFINAGNDLRATHTWRVQYHRPTLLVSFGQYCGVGSGRRRLGMHFIHGHKGSIYNLV